MNELSPAEALKLFEDQGKETESEPEKKTDPAPAEVKTDAAPVKEPEAQEVEPQGVATKDGKHVIPYSVLASERTARTNAERQLQETLARITALEAAKTAPEQAAKPGGADTMDAEADSRIAELAEDFPTVAAELKAMRELVKHLGGKLKPLEQSTQAIHAARASEQAETVQDAIDSLPKMAHIQATNPELFELAKTFDNTLQGRPEWQSKPLAERFAKVIELVEASNGAISVPGQKVPSAADQAALRDAATEKVAAAAKTVPTSLSQFPSGEPVATDEAGAANAMSNAQLASKFARMKPDQIDAYLASL